MGWTPQAADLARHQRPRMNRLALCEQVWMLAAGRLGWLEVLYRAAGATGRKSDADGQLGPRLCGRPGGQRNVQWVSEDLGQRENVKKCVKYGQVWEEQPGYGSAQGNITWGLLTDPLDHQHIIGRTRVANAQS